MSTGACACGRLALTSGAAGARSPRPAERRAGRHRPGGRAGRALNDRARGQVTLGATFPGAQPAVAAWAGLGPGPNWEARRADLPKQSCWAGGAGGGGELERRRPANWTCSASSSASSGDRAPGCPAASRFPGGRHGAILRPTLPPLPPALRSNKGAGLRAGSGRRGSGRSEPLARSWGVAGPRRRRAGGRSLPRAFSRRGARRSRGLPQPIGEPPGAAPPCFGAVSADGKLSGVWQTWCLRARARFALGLFCFWRNYWAGRLHKSGAVLIGCQNSFSLSDLV